MRVTIGLTCAVPSTSLVWPWNCGSAMRTVTTATRPARISSRSTRMAPSLRFTLSLRALSSTALRICLVMPLRNPSTCMPPPGVSTTLTKLRIVVSYPLTHRRAMSTPQVRVIVRACRSPLSSTAWVSSSYVSSPVMRQMSETASPLDRKSTKSLTPPVCRNSSTRAWPWAGVAGPDGTGSATSDSAATVEKPSRPGVGAASAVPASPSAETASSISRTSSTDSSPVSGMFSSMTVIRSPGTRKLVWRTRSMSCS